MPTTASTIPRSPVDAINSLSPGDRRVLNENELAQRWGLSPKTLQRWRSEGRGPRYLIRLVTTGFLLALVAGAVIKLKVFGGGQ